MLALLLLAGCKTQQLPPKVEYIERVETVEKTVIEKDTVTITLPSEQSTNITTDTTSTVNTSLAVSTASVYDGKLFHSIYNKPNLQLPVETKHIYTTKDSIIYKDRVTTVEVERAFTKMESVKIKYFWWLILGYLCLFVWGLRKPIAKLLAKLGKF